MANLINSLTAAMRIKGAMAVTVVDVETGMALGQAGGSVKNMAKAAVGDTNLLRIEMRTIANLGLDDVIDDILITLGKQYHVIVPIKTKGCAGLFLYLVLDKTVANLAMARRTFTDIAREFSL